MSPEQKGFLFFAVIKMLVVFTMMMVGVALLTLMERKVAGWMQNRPGPNRVGPFGLLQPAADGIKNFIKEETRPISANNLLFLLAPALSFVPAVMLIGVIPLAAPLPVNFDATLPLIGQVAYHGLMPMSVAEAPSSVRYRARIGAMSPNPIPQSSCAPPRARVSRDRPMPVCGPSRAPPSGEPRTRRAPPREGPAR